MKRKKQQQRQTGQPEDLCSSKSNESPDRSKTIRQPVSYFVAAAVSLLTLVVYLPALRNGFVSWDDGLYVFDNLHIRSLNWAFFKWALTDVSSTVYWHPLTWISHAVDYAFWGLNPLGHHLTSIVLHAINTSIVVLLIIRLLETANASRVGDASVFPDERGILITAAVTGMLFGLHPIHVESAAWVAERKDLLYSLFYLLSIMSYTGYVNSLASAGLHGRFYINRRYYLSLALFALSLSSKPMAVTLPIVLLILDWYPFNRVLSRKDVVAAIVEKLPFIALSAIVSAVTVMGQHAIGAMSSLEQAPFTSRLLVAFRALMLYLWKIIAPVHLLPLYSYPQDVSLSSPEYFSAILLVAGITVVCILIAKKRQLWLSVWGYFFITVFPVLGFFQAGPQFMADRFIYLPSLGAFLLAGLGVARCRAKAGALKQWGPTVKRLLAATAFVMVITLSYLTLKQISVWKSGIDLWNYFIDSGADRDPLAYNNRGVAFEKTGQFDLAVKDYSAAIALKPDYSGALVNRGSIYQKTGQFDLAVKDYSAAINLNSSLEVGWKARSNRGAVFYLEKQYERAVEDFDAALALNREGVEGYNNRGLAFEHMGQVDRAIEDYTRALALRPDLARVYVHRGGLYQKKGNSNLAAKDYQKACEMGDQEGCDALHNAK